MPTADEQMEDLQPQPQSSNHDRTTPRTREQDIAEIESYSRKMVKALNDRDFTNPLFQLATPDFRAGEIDIFPRTNTPDAHLAKFQQMGEEHPEYHMELEAISTELTPCGESAKVYLTITGTGRPPGLTRGALGVLTWRKAAGQWRIIQHESMRTFVL